MTLKGILNKGIILIADISGFTKFVNETEIAHGAHIIAELLEIISKSNILGLKVAQVEGDAILFYKKSEKPTIEEIYDQCEKMFIAFHQHIKMYYRDRVCDCGSCSNTEILTLKFVVHYGKVVERDVLGLFQLMGPEVTTAHKLMKNNISIHEYLLITENSVIDSNTSNMPDWFNVENDSIYYDDVGNVNYTYSYFTPLLKNIPDPPQRKELIKSSNPIVFKKEIKCSIKSVHELLISVNRKPEWVSGLKKVKYDENKLERIGVKHECILPLNSLHMEASKNEVLENKIIYAETVDPSGVYPAFNQVFVIEELETNLCCLSLEIHHESSFIQKFFFETFMAGTTKKSLTKLKILCEKENFYS